MSTGIIQRPDWHTYFLSIATSVAQRSDCTRAKVGAVIVDRSRRIVATGYVGTVPGQFGCLDGQCPRGKMTLDECAPGSDYSNCISFHAEVNALLHSDRSRHEHGTIYVTREPCDWCGKLLAASGLEWAVWRHGQHGAWHRATTRSLLSRG